MLRKERPSVFLGLEQIAGFVVDRRFPRSGFLVVPGPGLEESAQLGPAGGDADPAIVDVKLGQALGFRLVAQIGRVGAPLEAGP